MDILVIDRDSLTNQLIASRLAAKGHAVTLEPGKTEALEKAGAAVFDCIMVDPYPLSEPRPVIVGLWKSIRSRYRPYLMLLSKTATAQEAVMAGANDVIGKPLNGQDLDDKIGNAQRLLDVVRHLAREDNVHSSGGMIGKAAFNQLFLSAIDRAFRYGELSLIVFVSMSNHGEIAAAAGAAAAEDTVQKLTEKMTFMRRQSDVIGRLGACEFGILLQRPQYESEALDAFARFAETLEKFCLGFDDKALAPRLQLRLVLLPQGALQRQQAVPASAAAAATHV